MKIKNKKAAMEMTVGTIVTIVLLMSALVLGLILTRTIFVTSQDNINSVDQKVKDQITKLFSEDDLSKVVIYPSRNIEIKKGDSESGFGLSIRNVDSTPGVFSYAVTNTDSSCGITKTGAENLIVLRRTQEDIRIGGGDVMSQPILVVFDIPSTATPCLIAYTINVKKDGSQYERVDFNLKITGR